MSTTSTAPQWIATPGKPVTAHVPEMCLGQARAWLVDHRDEIRRGLDEHGALYLRGLPVRSVEDFAAVRDTVVTEAASYKEKATPRSHFGSDVFSSTDLPPQQSIRPHNENSYALEFPGVLVFGCLIAPDEGGATPVTDVRKVLRNIPAPLADRFREHGWGLVRNYGEHLGLSWQTAFGTEDRAAVAEYCRRNLTAHEWCADGHLRTVQRRTATIRHPRTGAEVWFNHMVFWNEWSLDPDVREVLAEDFGAENLPFGTSCGDGTPVTREDIATIDAAYRDATVRESWRPGDVMIVDNILTAHGREPYRGSRKIVVAMGDPVSLDDCAPSAAALAGFAAGVKRRRTSRWRRGS